ncbi:MAG: phytanoyl-CoA dioxygenase family protein [Verrucomicrobia bacterium]|nr:phytanoyl-CoA dioxygenase family protein [Verrucomicrobiota bacterium]
MSKPSTSDFFRDGFVVIDEVLTQDCCDRIAECLPNIGSSGSRALLEVECFQELAGDIRRNEKLAGILEDLVAIQCIYFRKTKEHNWSIKMHRDRVVPVEGSGPWDSSGVKEGMKSVRPPLDFLNGCVAVRVSLDGAPEGDLLVVPGSHQSDDAPARGDAISVPVGKGGVMLMRPLLVHGSTKLETSPSRRVLHFLYAPAELPDEYQWYHTV